MHQRFDTRMFKMAEELEKTTGNFKYLLGKEIIIKITKIKSRKKF